MLITQDILSRFNGKIAKAIEGNWKGIDYMRVKHANVANPKTEGQIDQRSKFSTALRFLQPLNEFFKVGYKNYAVKMTQFNSAMSYTLKNAMTGAYPDFTIDYANTLVSRGALTVAKNGAVSSSSNGVVDFAWTDNSGDGSSKATDNAMLLIINKVKVEAIFTTAGNTKSTEGQTLAIPDDYTSNQVECFISFVIEDGLTVSNGKEVGSATRNS